ncbi:MAG: hypothetical protein ACKOGA_11540, partial [Planctomycetaceae bacterium]
LDLQLNETVPQGRGVACIGDEYLRLDAVWQSGEWRVPGELAAAARREPRPAIASELNWGIRLCLATPFSVASRLPTALARALSIAPRSG